MAEIGGLPMIVQVWKRAMEADVGPVLVAAPEEEIIEAVNDAGGTGVLTDAALPSGSDRIAQALAAPTLKGAMASWSTCRGICRP